MSAYKRQHHLNRLSTITTLSNIRKMKTTFSSVIILLIAAAFAIDARPIGPFFKGKGKAAVGAANLPAKENILDKSLAYNAAREAKKQRQLSESQCKERNNVIESIECFVIAALGKEESLHLALEELQKHTASEIQSKCGENNPAFTAAMLVAHYKPFNGVSSTPKLEKDLVDKEPGFAGMRGNRRQCYPLFGYPANTDTAHQAVGSHANAAGGHDDEDHLLDVYSGQLKEIKRKALSMQRKLKEEGGKN